MKNKHFGWTAAGVLALALVLVSAQSADTPLRAGWEGPRPENIVSFHVPIPAGGQKVTVPLAPQNLIITDLYFGVGTQLAASVNGTQILYLLKDAGPIRFRSGIPVPRGAVLEVWNPTGNTAHANLSGYYY